MDDVVKSLLVLKGLDEQRFSTRKRIVDLPSALARQEKDVRAAQQALETIQEQVTALQMRVDHRGVELSKAEGDVARMEGQLSSLKTNADYSAMQSQIKRKQEEMSGIEDRILEAMEVVENARGGIPDKKKHLEAMKAELEAAKVDVAKKVAEAEVAVKRLDAEWLEAAKAVPAEVLEVYKAQLKRYGRDAMAGLTSDGNCQGCYTRVTGQVANEAAAGHLVQCNNCERVIYQG